MRCSALQCVAVRCSALQCVAVHMSRHIYMSRYIWHMFSKWRTEIIWFFLNSTQEEFHWKRSQQKTPFADNVVIFARSNRWPFIWHGDFWRCVQLQPHGAGTKLPDTYATLSRLLLCSLKSVLQCVAVRCSALQCVAVCCSALQCVAVRCTPTPPFKVCCNALQNVAVRRSALHTYTTL